MINFKQIWNLFQNLVNYLKITIAFSISMIGLLFSTHVYALSNARNLIFQGIGRETFIFGISAITFLFANTIYRNNKSIFWDTLQDFSALGGLLCIVLSILLLIDLI